MSETWQNTYALRKQLRRLLLILVIITGLNAFLFWKALHHLFDANSRVNHLENIVALASDLERHFFEEDKLRGGESAKEKKNLNELRSEIRSDLKSVREMVTEKDNIKLIRQIQSEWTVAKDKKAATQLLILIRSFISNEQRLLDPLQASASDATKATLSFLAVYVVIFALVILFLGQYLNRRVFLPLQRLSERMKHFQAGNHELPPLNQVHDEIGYLESQFYNMAGRVGETVTELKELDRVKTDFISIASHELRTPMTSVKGSLSLILSGSLSELTSDVQEVLTIAEKETDRLIRLINDILDLTKMEAKKLPLDKKWHGLHDVIEGAVQGLRGLYEVTKVSVKIQSGGQSGKVFIDRDRITQVITNLLSNAVKFSPAGETVMVSYVFNKSGAVISVSDCGPGIRSEDHSHMFEKFRSMDAGKSKIIRGTGLGLPICKALVEQHGGQIGLHSIVGKGSTFYFNLPEASAGAGTNTSPKDSQEAA